jgi:hypothetical protein
LPSRLDFGFDHGDSFEAGKARLAGVAPVGKEPAAIVADDLAAHRDAAMAAIGGIGR